MLQAREEDIDRITELFHRVLKGEIPQPISLPADVPDNELRQVVEYANRFATEYHALADAMSAVSRGELDFDVPMGRMHVLQSFKNLHANLRHLTWKTQQIAGGDLSQHIDFMGDFSQAFNSMTQQLKEAFARIDRQNQDLADANQRMKRDLDAAASMQRDLLPKALPDLLGARFSWFYEPCDELGGDILNVLPLDDRHVGMYLLDVSGHGVPAALLSVTINRVLTTRDPSASILISQRPGESRSDVVPPQQVAVHLNRQFPMASQSGRYFTIAYAVLDTQTRRLRYILAGQPAPILARKGQPPEQLTGSGFPIGLVDDAEFDEYSLQMEPGDRLYFYSDGITEARNEPGDMLQPGGLIPLVEQSRARPIEDGVQEIIKAVTDWCHPLAFDDDLSLLVLEVPDMET